MGTNFMVFFVALIPVLFMVLLPIALLVALQVWVCRKSLKLGLILPGFSLALSLLIVFSMAAFGTLTVTAGNTLVTSIEGGASQGGVVTEPSEQLEFQETQKLEIQPETLLAVGMLFLVTNIPTAVYGGIWLHYKGRKDTMEDLKRMQIEDLG